MSVEQNKAIVRRSLEEPLKGNTSVYTEVIAPDYTRWIAGALTQWRGVEGFKRIFDLWLAVFPDLALTIEEMVAEGDKVVCRQTWRGTHRGDWVSPLLGRTIGPTGRQITITATVISRIADGTIAEEWEDWDNIGLLQQIGAFTGTV